MPYITPVPNEEVELLSVSQASVLTGLSRDTIAEAMNCWHSSKGAFGLRYVCPNTRRLVRRESLREWLVSLERRAAQR